MKTARRDFLLLGGGAAVGVVFTPAPWKLLDDVSIWTQNWSWIPRPLQGETKFRHTVCTMCPEGCAVRARCIGDQPISLAGVPEHPISQGRLCVLGIGAHQLPHHPRRTPEAAPDAATRIASLLAEKHTKVMLDMCPGRAASALYSRIEGLTYTTVEGCDPAAEPVGVDVTKARTIVSFGAPVLETWGPVLAAWSGDLRPTIVQVDPVQSRSAVLADMWLPVRPGTEGVLAKALASGAQVESAAQQCGLGVDAIWTTLAKMKANGPLLAIAGALPNDSQAEIALINVGSPAIVRRAASPIVPPAAKRFDSVEDGSIDLLVIDHGPVAASPGWERIARKLAKNATVVSFTPYVAGDLNRAGMLMPAPAWLEIADDVVQSPDAPVPAYSVAPALLSARKGSVDPVDALTGSTGARESELKARIELIFKSGKGDVFSFADAGRTAVKDFESSEKLWEKFQEGATWMGEPSAPLKGDSPRHASFARAALRPDAGVLPPLTCKLTRESRLYTRSA